MIHGYNRTVANILINAASHNRRLCVYITEGRPVSTGSQTLKLLEEANITTKLIPDTTVAYIMNDIDLVLVGAEAVVENGGILNTVYYYDLD